MWVSRPYASERLGYVTEVNWPIKTEKRRTGTRQELHYGTVVDEKFCPRFLCHLLIANSRTDSVQKTNPRASFTLKELFTNSWILPSSFHFGYSDSQAPAHHQEGAVKRATTKVQLDLQHCCKMSWLSMLRVLPPTRKYLATLFVMGGKARNITIQLVLQNCCKTSCTFVVVPFTVA